MGQLKPLEYYHIGNTPLIFAESINNNNIYIKLESENFLGSVKARTGYFMIQALSDEHRSKTIIEATSGNLGFALGFLCKEADLNFMCLIDESIAKAKLQRLREKHIRYEIVKQENGYDLRTSRIRLAQRMAADGNYYWINQYGNDNAVQAHALTTAPEIFAQMNGKIDFCFCPMGSCGTICGISRYLKRVLPDVKICGVEPLGSTIYAQYDAKYINAGAGLKGKPSNIINNPDTVDMNFVVSDDEAICTSKKILKELNVSLGITSGMAYAAALKTAQNKSGVNIVVIAPDGGESYAEYF